MQADKLREDELRAVRSAMANAEHDAGDVDDVSPRIEDDEDAYWAYCTYHGLRRLLAIAEAAEDLRAVCAQLREELAGWESDFDTQASHCIELMQERAAMTELLRECRPMVWAATAGSGLHIDAALRRRIDAALSTVAPVRESP